MKVSQEQKQETRRKIIDAAAELFVTQGFDTTSMKQIARQAGVGDATIYKYFPSKDQLVTGFYELRGQQAISAYREAEASEEYNFCEKLQLLVDTYFEQLCADREFVELSLKQFARSPLSMLKDELSIARDYRALFQELLEEAEASGYPAIPMKGILSGMATDILLGLTLYWIKDTSEEFHHTTQLSDLGIQMFDQLLKSGLINSAMDMLGFLVKAHLVRGIGNSGKIIAMMKEFSGAMSAHMKDADHE